MFVDKTNDVSKFTVWIYLASNVLQWSYEQFHLKVINILAHWSRLVFLFCTTDSLMSIAQKIQNRQYRRSRKHDMHKMFLANIKRERLGNYIFKLLFVESDLILTNVRTRLSGFTSFCFTFHLQCYLDRHTQKFFWCSGNSRRLPDTKFIGSACSALKWICWAQCPIQFHLTVRFGRAMRYAYDVYCALRTKNFVKNYWIFLQTVCLILHCVVLCTCSRPIFPRRNIPRNT